VYLKAFIFAAPLVAAVVYFGRGRLWYSADQAGDLAEFAAALLTAPFALYMRRTRGFVIYVALTVLLTGNRYALEWQKMDGEARQTFRNATYATCIKEPPEDAESGKWAQFCTCYTDAVLKEFSIRELAAFGRSMKSGTPDPSIKTRVQPLVERCAAQGETP